MLRITKRGDLSSRDELLLRAAAVLAALAASSVIMAALGYNPLEIFKNLFDGATGSPYRLRQTIHKTIPLVVLSLGVAVAFKMKFWNIGAEGQMCMGAFGASCVALYYPRLPAAAMLPLMLLAALVCGGLWALVPALLKVKFNTSETLVTLMLNYIAISWITYLQYGPWKDPQGIGFPKIANFVPAAVLPSTFGVHIGWMVALALAVLIHILLRKSKLGYEIAVIGESETTARYAGINVARVMVIAVMLSGGLCGMAGMMQASAIEHSLNDQISGGLGFTAIITTWLAQLSAPVIVGVSFLFAVMIQGGAYLQSAMKVPATIAEVLQGVIIFFVLGSEFFIRYSIKPRREPAAKGGSRA